MIYVQINGKTRAMDLLEYLNSTEDGYQGLIADNIGWSGDTPLEGELDEFIEDIPEDLYKTKDNIPD